MNKEKLKKKLAEEGFLYVYEWRDRPGTKYPPHAHKGKVSFYLTAGCLTFDFSGEKIQVKKGERFDVPIGKTHSAEVDPAGCSYIVGEMIEGDS